MKKIGLLNQPLSAVIAGLGHTDTLVIADAGLPIPTTTQRIDLALVNGVPTFLETLQAVLVEMQVERAIIATEMAGANDHICVGARHAVPLHRCGHSITLRTRWSISR